MKIFHIVFSFITLTSFAISQTPDSLNFFPAHAGDVRQYRSQFTNEIISTEYFDKDSTDQLGNVFIWRRVGGILKIDTLNNLYSLDAVNDTVNQTLVYKLSADTGTVWTRVKRERDSILAKVVGIFPGFVYGKQVTVKKIEKTRYSEVGPFWIGNEYLATGFGLVQEDIEPSDVYVLAGAIINGVKYGTVVSVKETSNIAESFEVLTNYPNPFNNATIISYTVSKNSKVNIVVYDVLGREVKTLVDERMEKGSYEISFDGNGLTSGMYFAVLKTASQTLIDKLLLIK